MARTWFQEQTVASIILIVTCTTLFVVRTADPSKIILDLTKPINSVISNKISIDNFVSTLKSSGILNDRNLDSISTSLLYATGNYKSAIFLL